ncbi:Fic family protein [Candidatus Micrarchaeota archaeon]|nr:Fic family protein [Candidatus Micrarchaeota archaeon]
MASIRKRKVGKHTYYYLEHALRRNGKVEKRELYLGKTLPKNLNEIKSNFLGQVYKEKWFSALEKIRNAAAKENRVTPPSAREQELEKFSIKFTYDTQRIEGSTLTLRETADLLEKGISPRAKPVRDAKEAEAHQKLFYEMLETKKNPSLQLVLEWHHKLFSETKPDLAGKVRQHQVAIAGSRFMPPSPAEVPPLLGEFFKWYARSKDKTHPVELAALAHLKFVTIHPFADGNGRVSRLLMNFVLYRNGFPMLNIPYEGRSGYYRALERAQTKRLDATFVQWLFKRYLKEYARYLKVKQK